MTSIGVNPPPSPHTIFIDSLDKKNVPLASDGAGPKYFEYKKRELEKAIENDVPANKDKTEPSPLKTLDTKDFKNVMMDGGGRYFREKQSEILKNTSIISNNLFPEHEVTPKEIANEIIFENNPDKQFKSIMSFQNKVEKMDPEKLNELSTYLESLQGSFPGENKSGSLNKTDLVHEMLNTVNRQIFSKFK